MANIERSSKNFSWIILVIMLVSDEYVHLNAQKFQLDQYLGCFHDNEIRGAFDENLTVEACIQHCKLNTTQSYAKLQNGTHCECVTEYGNVLQVKDSLCSITCIGNPRQHCGGSNNSFSAYVLYAVCPIGTYGSQCNQGCHCKRQMPCDRQSGNCRECHGNYTGATCNELKLSPAQYIGCYRDNSTYRAMERKIYVSNKNTLQRCADRCSSANHSYAGPQFGNECFCGESYDKYGPRNEAGCSSECRGNSEEMCGGGEALSVYHSCPAGFYGRFCAKVCNCETNNRCGFHNGTCPNNTCKSGWSGDACNLRNCSNANGDCNSNELCVSVEPILSEAISVCRLCRLDYGRTSEDVYICTDALQNQYLGCFYEEGETGYNTNKAVSALAFLSDVSVTAKDCWKFCKNSNSTLSYARLWNETYCDCVDKIAGLRNDSLCNTTCGIYSNLSCTGLTHSDVHIYILYAVCPNNTFGSDCEKTCSCMGPCNRKTGECLNDPCDQPDLPLAKRFECFVNLIMPYLIYIAPALAVVVILVVIAIFYCCRSRNRKGEDFQTKRAKTATLLSTGITKNIWKPPAMPDIEACEKRNPASINNSVEDLTKAANTDSENCKEQYQAALNKGTDADKNKINPKKRLKIPTPDDPDFKELATLSKQETRRKTKKPIIPDPDQCVKMQPELDKSTDEKTKRKPKKCSNPEAKVSEEKDQDELGKSADEKTQRKPKKRALPVPKGHEVKEHEDLGKSADENTKKKKTKKLAAPDTEKIEEKEQTPTKSTRKSNLYVSAERGTTNKPALPIARETKMLSKQSKLTKQNDYEVKSAPKKSADDDSEGEVYTGLENSASNDYEGEVYTALEAGNTAAACSNKSTVSCKPNRK